MRRVHTLKMDLWQVLWIEVIHVVAIHDVVINLLSSISPNA